MLRLPQWVRNLRKAVGLDCALILALLALTCLVRWVSLQRIENGGDPLDNWYFVKQWSYNAAPFSGHLNHHSARVGIHGITWIAQKLFGTETIYYYVAPLFASHACSLLTYCLGRLAVSRSVGVVAVLLLLEFNPFGFASSQLRPGVFEAMYIVGAATCVLAFVKRGTSSGTWALVGAGLFSFLGYLTKVPTLFVAPGFALVILLAGGGLRELLIYGGVMLAGLGLETLAYNLFTEYPHRAAIIMGSHGSGRIRPHSFWWLLTRFSKASDSWRLVFYFYFASGFTILTQRRPLAEKATVWFTASILLLATFGVRTINPVSTWMGMIDRYLTLAIPLALVVNATVLVDAATATGGWLRRQVGRLSKTGQHFYERHAPLLGAGILLLCALAVGTKAWNTNEKKRLHHPITEMRRLNSLISDAYARKLPIVAKVTRSPTKKRRWTQVRALHWALKGFVNEELMLDEAGHLPHFDYNKSIAKLNRKQWYAPATPSLSAGKVKAMLKKQRRCVLKLSDHGINVKVSSTKRWEMPASCQPPS